MSFTDELVADTHALQCLRPLLGDSYLPFTSSTMRPAAIALVANDIVLHDRRRVLECGSGSSTVILARLLAGRGGRIVSIEHDPVWAAVVRDMVARERLDGTATIVEAPLRAAPVGTLDWYDADLVSGALSEYACDLLVVDGPPAHRPGLELARLPALPVLMKHFASSCTVVLDDADRHGEQQVMRSWSLETGVLFSLHPREGVAVARFGEAPFAL